MSIPELLGRLLARSSNALRRERVLVFVGGLSISAAVLLAFSPVVPAPLARLGAAFNSHAVIAIVAIATAGIGMLEGYRRTELTSEGPDLEQIPEEPPSRDTRHPGEGIDKPFDQITDVEVKLSSQEYEAKERRVRLQLRETAVTVVADAKGISLEQARERVDSGSWTDRVRVAEFLGDDSVTLPLEIRISDWFSGVSFERTVRETIDEIERLAELPETGSSDDSNRTDIETEFTRGGGVTAGNVSVTDATNRQSKTLTAVDAEEIGNNRWNIGFIAAFLLSGFGFMWSSTALVLGGGIAMGYVAYGYLTRAPAMTLEVTRAISDSSPVPGEPVTVLLTVENVGDHPIPEVRAIDGVPADVNVVDGTPRGCDSLNPGESMTISYTIEAVRGTHEFEPVSVWTYNVSGSIERSAKAELPLDLQCRDPLESVSIHGNTTPFTGQIPTDDGGQGVEFHATREYQSTDPLKQIDWNYWARTGEPRTIEFRQHRAADVVVLLDDRAFCRRSRDDYTPDAVSLGRHASLRVADALLDESNAVGFGTIDSRAFVAPARGRDQLRRIERAIVDSETEEDEESRTSLFDSVRGQYFTNRRTSPDPEPKQSMPNLGGQRFMTDGGAIASWLRKRLPGASHVVFITPLLDELPGRLARRLTAEDHEVMIISPNVTTTETPGGTVARIERHERIRSIRSQNIRVTDWPSERPLSVALERASQRWSL